jgi:uncharacterized protein with GYD domain
MTKYAFFFSYTADSWARMISAPGDRTAAVREVLGSMGGSLESIYWTLGSHDGIIIADLPDSVSAEAANIAVASTGTFTENQTQELLTQEQLDAALQQASSVTKVFQAPGRQR